MLTRFRQGLLRTPRRPLACALALSVLAGCAAGDGSDRLSRAPSGGRFFEGYVDYRYVTAQGFELSRSACVVQGQNMRCEVMLGGAPFSSQGYRGASNELCFRIGAGPWMPIDVRRVMANQSAADRADEAARLRFLGHRDYVLGRPCDEVEHRAKDGSTTVTCYSVVDYFAGKQALVPVAAEQGYQPKVVAGVGLGIPLRAVDYEPSGRPAGRTEVTRIQPAAVDPRALDGICAR